MWSGQEPSWDGPIDRGSHCAKGTAVRGLVSGEHRGKGASRERRQCGGNYGGEVETTAP